MLHCQNKYASYNGEIQQKKTSTEHFKKNFDDHDVKTLELYTFL